jgi:hypothetical protein
MTDTTSIERRKSWPGAIDLLALTATPTFALMALLTYCFGGGAADMLCGAAPGMSPLGGMVPMYLLMSAFHLAPWLKLVGRSAHPSRG